MFHHQLLIISFKVQFNVQQILTGHIEMYLVWEVAIWNFQYLIVFDTPPTPLHKKKKGKKETNPSNSVSS